MTVLFKKTFQPFSSSLVSDRRLALFLLVPLNLHKPIVNLLSPDEGLLWFALNLDGPCGEIS